MLYTYDYVILFLILGYANKIYLNLTSYVPYTLSILFRKNVTQTL